MRPGDGEECIKEDEVGHSLRLVKMVWSVDNYFLSIRTTKKSWSVVHQAEE